MKILYTTQATATGGREGSAKTADGVLDVTLSTPKEIGGAGGPGTNPEQLFAAGYSACFLGARKFVAGTAKVQIPDDATVTGKVGFGPRDDEKASASRWSSSFPCPASTRKPCAISLIRHTSFVPTRTRPAATSRSP